LPPGKTKAPPNTAEAVWRRNKKTCRPFWGSSRNNTTVAEALGGVVMISLLSCINRSDEAKIT
jgi:hypothetical protein